MNDLMNVCEKSFTTIQNYLMGKQSLLKPKKPISSDVSLRVIRTKSEENFEVN